MCRGKEGRIYVAPNTDAEAVIKRLDIRDKWEQEQIRKYCAEQKRIDRERFWRKVKALAGEYVIPAFGVLLFLAFIFAVTVVLYGWK